MIIQPVESNLETFLCPVLLHDLPVRKEAVSKARFEKTSLGKKKEGCPFRDSLPIHAINRLCLILHQATYLR